MSINSNTCAQWAQSIEENAQQNGFTDSAEMLQFAIDTFGVDVCQVVFCHVSDWLCWGHSAVLYNRNAQCTLVFKAALERAMDDNGILRGQFDCSLEDITVHCRRFNRKITSKVYPSKIRAFLRWMAATGFIGDCVSGQWQSHAPNKIINPNLPMLLHYAHLTQQHIVRTYGAEALPTHRNIQTAKEWAAVWRGNADYWQSFGAGDDADDAPMSFSDEIGRRIFILKCELNNWRQFADAAAQRMATVLTHKIQWLESRLAAFNQWRFVPSR